MLSLKDELISLLEEILPRTKFYLLKQYTPLTSKSGFLNSEDYRTEHERVMVDAFMQQRLPTPSEFTRPALDDDDIDRFPEEHFNRLVALVEQLLEPYIDSDSHSFVAVLPATWIGIGNLVQRVEHLSKSIVRCAALFGVSETVDTVLRLVDGEVANYKQVVVLDGVNPPPSKRKEGVDLWPGARLTGC